MKIAETTVLCAIVFSLCSCGGVTKDQFHSVWNYYMELKLEAMQKNPDTPDAELKNKAAAQFGFQDWESFKAKAQSSLGDDYRKLTQDKLKELSMTYSIMMKDGDESVKNKDFYKDK